MKSNPRKRPRGAAEEQYDDKRNRRGGRLLLNPDDPESCTTPEMLFNLALSEVAEENPLMPGEAKAFEKVFGYKVKKVPGGGGGGYYRAFFERCRFVLQHRVGALNFLEGVHGVATVSSMTVEYPEWFGRLINKWARINFKRIAHHGIDWGEGTLTYHDIGLSHAPHWTDAVIEDWGKRHGLTFVEIDRETFRPELLFADKAGKKVRVSEAKNVHMWANSKPKTIKIGKLLRKLGVSPDEIKTFETRQVDLEWHITADPGEVARMSYGRGWTSCMRPGEAYETGPLTDVMAGSALILFYRPGADEPVGREVLRPAVGARAPYIIRSGQTYGTAGEISNAELMDEIEGQTGVAIAVDTRGLKDADYALTQGIYDDFIRLSAPEQSEDRMLKAAAELHRVFDPLNEGHGTLEEPERLLPEMSRGEVKRNPRRGRHRP